jgi:hypothetical protein
MNDYASENGAFCFCLVNNLLRKTAQRCLETLWATAIELQTAVNSLAECFQAISWKIYAEAKTKRISSNNRAD